MCIQSALMRIGRIHTVNAEKPNLIECASSSQSTCWGGLKPDWTGLEWNVVGCGLHHVTTCELLLWEWLLGGRTWRRRQARMWRRRHCWGSGITTGSIFFVNIVRVICTRQGHAQISFSEFALVRIEKPCSADVIKLDWTRLKPVQTIRFERTLDPVCSADRPLMAVIEEVFRILHKGWSSIYSSNRMGPGALHSLCVSARTEAPNN